MKNTRFASRQKSEKLEFSRMANTRFSDWAADGSSPALSRRRGGPALRVQDARPQQRRESPRRRRYGCALLLFCEELLSLHRVQVESTRGLTVLTDHAATANGGVHTRVKVTKRSTPGNFFLSTPPTLHVLGRRTPPKPEPVRGRPRTGSSLVTLTPQA